MTERMMGTGLEGLGLDLEPTHLSFDQHEAHMDNIARKAQLEQQARQRAAQQAHAEAQARATASAQSQDLTRSLVERKPRMSPKKRRAIIGTISGVVVGGLLFGVYEGNLFGVQPEIEALLNGTNSGQSPNANGLTVIAPETKGSTSLDSEHCDLPGNMYMVATVDAYYPLVPVLPATSAETGKPVTTKILPYMTKAAEKKLPEAQQAEFDKFVTQSDGHANTQNDGYTNFTVNKLPLALEICDPLGTLSETNGVYTIDRSKLKVSFEDPIDLFKTPINPQYQINSATDVKLDPSKSEYVTMPNPLKNMYVNTGSDAVLKQSVADLTKSLEDPAQEKLLLALTEQGVVQELNNPTDAADKINYPGTSDKVLKDIVDNLLTERLNTTVAKTHWKGSNYSFSADVPNDPKTKLPITTEAPTTLKDLDATQQVQILDISVQYGGLKTPKTTAPTPTPKSTELSPP